MNKLLYSPLLSDITFRIQNQTIHAHKLVLYARCSKLYEIVKNEKSITFNQFSLNNFLFILNFIYTGDWSNNFLFQYYSFQPQTPIDVNFLNTNFTNQFLIECLEMSFLFDITQLVRLIELKLIDNIQVNSLVELFHVAEKYNLRALEVSAVIWLANSDAVCDFPFQKVSNRVKYLVAYQFFPEKSNNHHNYNNNNNNSNNM